VIELTGPDVRVLVDLDHGGRLASLVVDGRERLITGGPQAAPMLWGSYPMAPWAGRIRRGRLAFAGRSYQLPVDAAPHAIHGTVYRRAWRVDHDGSIMTELGPDWPFPGRARQHFELAPGSLRCTMEVHADTSPMPAAAGFHPWFAGPVELDVRPGRQYRRDAEGIPDGTLIPPDPRPWDDCFVELDGVPRLIFEDGLTVTVSSDADHWVIYTPDHAVCVEPQTGPPDGPNLAPQVVEPGRPLSVSMVVSWS
jgi:aldose 1-epimerase